MRILQIGDYPESENVIKGGIQSSLFGLINELIKKEHVVYVISLPNRNYRKDRSVESGNLNVYYFSNKHRYNILAVSRFFSISKKIRLCKADVCHLHGTDLTVFLIYIYCRLKKMPVTITVHGLAYIEKRNAFRKRKSIKNLLKYAIQSFFEFMILNVLREAIVDTPYVADSFIKLKKKGLLFRLPLFYIIPQGINEQFFTLPDKYEHDKLLSVGSIGERKGHLYLIQAVQRIMIDFPEIKLNIIGKIASQKYLEELNLYIAEKKLKNNISIHTNLTFSELIVYYVSSNIFVLHSEEESQGIVFCEAMACGKPIVATDSGGIPDVVTNGQGGLLSPFADTGSFAENIKTILKDPLVRNRFSSFNKENSSQYSWTVISEKIVEIYSSLTRQHE